MIARCCAIRCARTAGTRATALTWADTSGVRMSRETSLPLTRVHGSSGSVETSMHGSAARRRHQAASAVSVLSP